MAVDSGQPGGPTDEVSSSSSTSAVEAGHDEILTLAPVPGTTVDDAGTFFLAEQADDASKPVAEQTFGENGCHPEPIRFAQGKFREGSGSPDAEILRYAQDDRRGAQDDRRGAQDDRRGAQDDRRDTVQSPLTGSLLSERLVADPETPVPNPVTPIPEIALAEQAGQLQVGHLRVEQPDERAGQAPPLRGVTEVGAKLDGVAGVGAQLDGVAEVGAKLDGVAGVGAKSDGVTDGAAPDGVTEVGTMLDEVVGVEAMLDGVTDGATPDGVAKVGTMLDEVTGVEAKLDGVTDGAAPGGVAGVGAILDWGAGLVPPLREVAEVEAMLDEVTGVEAMFDGVTDGAAPDEVAEVGTMLDWGAGLVPPLREVAEVWAMLDEVVGRHYQAYRDGDKGAGMGAMLDGVARVEAGARYGGRGVVVEERRHLPVYAPHKTVLADARRSRQRRQFRLRHSARKHMRVARVKEQQTHTRFWVTLASVTLALLVVCLSLGGATAYVAYRFYHTTRVTFAPKILTLRDLLPLDNLKIYDSTGALIDQLTGNGIHTTVTYEQVSPYLRNATVATEDKNFWNNPGVDVLGIMRASLTDLQDGRLVEGGSTITQQLIKNLVVGDDPTIVRKLEEIILAPQLNDNYSKRDILTMYLNSIYYGHQAYGIDAAATVFFGLQDQAGRSAAAQLDLAQAAMLAGLPRNPSEYDPAVNFQTATDRFETVLTLMVKQGYISNVDKYDAILEEQGPDFFKFGTALQNRAPHFVNFVLAQLQKMFNIHNLAELSRSGMVVYTTLDVNLQDEIQKIAQQHIAELRDTNHVTNAAEVLIDFHTGAIISLLGSIDYYNNAIDGQYDVTQAYRQPGSSFKPYVYVTAFEQGASPAQAVNDAPIHIPVPNANPSTFSPTNYDNKFHGHMTLRCALQNSLNVPGVKVLQHVGIDAAMQTANNMGITSYRGTPGYSLVLGGLGVRLIDHTSAMGVFANGGVREPYYAINKVVSGTSGSVLYQHQVDPGTQVISPQLAYMMTNVLSDNTDRTPEFFDCNALQLYANSQQDCWHGNRGAVRPAAAKTGTTNDFRDNWTVGYTTDYVMGVWVGNDDNSPMINVSGISGAAPIWHDAMLLAEQGHAIQDFVDPGGLVQATVTYPDGVKTTDWFLPGTVPTFNKTPTPTADALPSPSPSPAADPDGNPSKPVPTPYCPASYSFAFAPPPAHAPAPDPGWW